MSSVNLEICSAGYFSIETPLGTYQRKILLCLSFCVPKKSMGGQNIFWDSVLLVRLTVQPLYMILNCQESELKYDSWR